MSLRDEIRALEQQLDPNDAETKALLAELHTKLQENPLEAFIPYPQQHEYLSARSPVKAFFGGNRAGKTTVGTVDDLIQAVDESALPEHLRQYKKWHPPFYGRVVAPAVSAYLEGVIYPAVRQWVPTHQLKGGKWDKAFSKEHRILHFANGSWIQFMTNKMDIADFGGAALHRVRYDEEPREDIRNECRIRLIDYGGDECFNMTPLMGLTHVFRTVWERRHEAHITAVRADMDDNPHLTESAKALALDANDLSAEELEARKHGKFVPLQGFVYPYFGNEHLVEAPSLQHVKGQNVVVGIDPGIRWTGVVWAAFDNDNACLVFAELKLDNATVEDVCRLIQETNRKWNVSPDYYVIDPSARNRAQATGEGVESAFARNGIYTTHGQNDLEAGVFQIKRRLQAGSFLVSKDCIQLIWELQHYQQDPKSEKEFAVIKKDDHLADAIRYVCMSRAWGAEKVFRPNKEHARYVPNYQEPWDGRDLPRPVSPPLGVMS